MFDFSVQLPTGTLPVSTQFVSELPESQSHASFQTTGDVNLGQAGDTTLPPGQKYLVVTTQFTIEPTVVEVGQSPGSNTPPSRLADFADITNPALAVFTVETAIMEVGQAGDPTLPTRPR